MPMVCPQCSDRYEQKLVCPRCRVRLDFQEESAPPAMGPAEENEAWQQTPWARIGLGLLLACGIYQGLNQLVQAALLAAGEDANQGIWAALSTVAAMQALQAIGLLVGGVLAGAGQRRGAAYGAFIGVFNGVLSVILMVREHQELTPVTFYGLPFLHAAIGAFAGFVGARIWRPLPTLRLGPVEAAAVSLPVHRGPSRFSGPIAWGRVLVGVAIAVCGAHWANTILDLVLEASEGKLALETNMQARLVTWEITGLAILAGGAIAGASKRNSLKQGVCVGFVTAIALVAFRYWGHHVLVMKDFIQQALCPVVLGVVGSWFGGQFFPPIVRTARRRERRYGQPAF